MKRSIALFLILIAWVAFDQTPKTDQMEQLFPWTDTEQWRVTHIYNIVEYITNFLILCLFFDMALILKKYMVGYEYYDLDLFINLFRIFIILYAIDFFDYLLYNNEEYFTFFLFNYKIRLSFNIIQFLVFGFFMYKYRMQYERTRSLI